VGGVENKFSGLLEPSVRYHYKRARILIGLLESGSLTVSGGQFVWGGCLIWGSSTVKLMLIFGYMLEGLFSQFTVYLMVNCRDVNYKTTLNVKLFYCRKSAGKSSSTML